MSEVLGLEHVSLQKTGPTLTLSVERGHSLCVLGPSGSGKSALLGVISGRLQPSRGRVRREGGIAVAAAVAVSRRVRPQTLAPQRGANNAALATEVLTALGLWECRAAPVGELPAGRAAACELIALLASGADLLVIDGQLDALDPWALRSTLALLRKRTASGAAVVVATNRSDLIAQFDAAVVLREGEVRFAGTVAELISHGPASGLEVATDRQRAVRALVEPFLVKVEETQSGLRIEAGEGQQIAARLLLDGYGDVRYVVVRRPTVEDALIQLVTS